MKILLTGSSGQQCGRGTLIKYEAVSTVFARALRLAGAEVTHEPYDMSKGMKGFDGVFIGLVPPFSVAAHYVNGALACLRDAEAAGVPVVMYLDDWRFFQVFSNLRSIIKDPQQLVKPFFSGRYYYEWATKDLNWFMEAIYRLQGEPWPVTLVPAFAWGDHAVLDKELLKSPDVVHADISSLAEWYPAPDMLPAPVSRERAWVFGTVTDQLKWLDGLGLTWPVEHFGGKASKAPGKLAEADLVAEYYRHWGVLSQPYERILASGWWRNRFVHSARAGAILLTDSREAPQLGEAYQLNASDVESLGYRDLADLAAGQQQALWATEPSQHEAAAQVMSALVMARERLK